MIIRTDSKNIFFILLDVVYTQEQWISATGVQQGSPAASLAARVYSCLFRSTTNVVAEYEKYYKQEYNNLWAYLYWHYLIDAETIDKIKKNYTPEKILFYGNAHAGGDYCVGDYALSEDDGYPLTKQIFANLKKKQTHEN